MTLKANKLINETSPYLLQHAYNPVDWYPWSEEAFEKSKSENKPILLSIGYAACHWCHVMEKESFENEEIAGIMNEKFVNIKVDREERPELDQVYMRFVQMFTGGGGWPMTVFLTPHQEPFFGGTYFPPQDRYGRIGFKKILLAVSNYYHFEKQKLAASLAEISQAYINSMQEHKEGPLPDRLMFNTAVNDLANFYDPEYGGIGTAPKFPAIEALRLFLRRYHHDRDKHFLDMVTFTLQNMARGGIYDQLGGGFSRYSVDAQWLVPHFEKMLYDNAQLTILYLDTYLLTRDKFYLEIAVDILAFILREFYSKEGGFYSSLDADSEGQEGKYYVWSKYNVLDVLGEEDGEIFCSFFDITHQGNFENKNILHVKSDINSLARQFNRTQEEIKEIISKSRKALFNKRLERQRPKLDDKIVVSWNGLMLSAFCRAYQVTGEEPYAQVVKQNIKFIKDNLYINKRLMHTFKDGQAKFGAFLDDHSHLIQGLLNAYESLFMDEYLAWAKELTDQVNEAFWDKKNHGYFYTSHEHEGLYKRLKDEHDQSVPSGSGVMLLNQLRLYSFTEQESYLKRTERILAKYANQSLQNPYAYGSFLNGVDFYLDQPKEILIIADSFEEGKNLLNTVYQQYLPNKIIILKLTGQDNSIVSSNILKGKKIIKNRPTAYVCHNYVCSEPCTKEADLGQALQR